MKWLYTAARFTDACYSCSDIGVFSHISASGSCEHITSTEHVEVYVTIAHKYRGDLQVTLISPSGVESILAYPRLEGTSPRSENYVEWRVRFFVASMFVSVS
jgi:subtilisin-like proprotein convertase family protein